MRLLRFCGLILLAPAILSSACTTAPRRSDIATAVTEDDALRNKFIEVLGWVREYEPPTGDRVRTWSFVLENEAGEELRAYIDDREAEEVAAADRLVRKAHQNDDPIWAVGYLRTGRYENVTSGPRLELREVRYKDEWVRLSARREPYPYYYDPFWGPYPYHPYGPWRHHHYHRHPYY